jgi:hypothetical protein
MVNFITRSLAGNKPGGNPYSPAAPGPAPAEAAPVPAGVQQIGDMLNAAMPLIEQITGLNRREISIQVLRSGLKGGGLDGIIAGLTGQIKPIAEPKFITYVKTIAVWVPIGLLVLGFGFITLYAYAMFIVRVMGKI